MYCTPAEGEHGHLRDNIIKAKAYYTYTAPQAATAAVAAILCQRAGVQPSSNPICPRTLACNQTAIQSPGLPFNGLHPRNPWITTYLPTREGWKAELAWLTHIGHFTHEVVTRQS